MGKSVLESVLSLFITRILLHTLSGQIDARYLVLLAVRITDHSTAPSAQAHDLPLGMRARAFSVLGS